MQLRIIFTSFRITIKEIVMSAITQITYNDGQTPANAKVFYPVNPQQGATPAMWKTREGSAMAAWALTQRVTSSASRSQVQTRITIPVMEIIPDGCCTTDIPKVSYQDIANIEVSLPLKSVASDRRDVLAMIRAHVASNTFGDAILNFEQVW